MPLQNQEVEYINSRLHKFRASVDDFRALFRDESKGAPFSFQGSPDEAYAIIARFQELFREKISCHLGPSLRYRTARPHNVSPRCTSWTGDPAS